MPRGTPDDDDLAFGDDGGEDDDPEDDDLLEGEVDAEAGRGDDEFGFDGESSGEVELGNDELDADEPFDAEVDADTVVSCPYCGETTQISLDYGSGAVQDYVEDCEVCCRPWRVRVRYDRSGAAEVTIEPT